MPNHAPSSPDLHFVHTLIDALPLSAPILDIQPIDLLTADGILAELDLTSRALRPVATLPAGVVDLTQPVAIHLARQARFAAVVNRFGRFGLVVSLESGTTAMHLDRDAYHEDVCEFPVAFFERSERTLIVHTTDWNRLDISDPANGSLLTARGPTSYGQGEPRPAHYLDYFHCGLLVSPDQEWIVDNGWAWHPWGVVRAWNLRRWLEENIWESEDGPSLRDLVDRAYLWDAPLCWIDSTTLAIWGEGRDEEEIVAAIRLIDVTTGADLHGFCGPDVTPHSVWPPNTGKRGWIAYDRVLFAISPAHGTGVWDLASDEQLLHEPTLKPHCYHRGVAQFLSLREDGAIVLSQLRVRGDG
jgi:hypothetical protein